MDRRIRSAWGPSSHRFSRSYPEEIHPLTLNTSHDWEPNMNRTSTFRHQWFLVYMNRGKGLMLIMRKLPGRQTEPTIRRRIVLFFIIGSSCQGSTSLTKYIIDKYRKTCHTIRGYDPSLWDGHQKYQKLPSSICCCPHGIDGQLLVLFRDKAGQIILP